MVLLAVSVNSIWVSSLDRGLHKAEVADQSLLQAYNESSTATWLMLDFGGPFRAGVFFSLGFSLVFWGSPPSSLLCCFYAFAFLFFVASLLCCFFASTLLSWCLLIIFCFYACLFSFSVSMLPFFCLSAFLFIYFSTSLCFSLFFVLNYSMFLPSRAFMCPPSSLLFCLIASAATTTAASTSKCERNNTSSKSNKKKRNKKNYNDKEKHIQHEVVVLSLFTFFGFFALV